MSGWSFGDTADQRNSLKLRGFLPSLLVVLGWNHVLWDWIRQADNEHSEPRMWSCLFALLLEKISLFSTDCQVSFLWHCSHSGWGVFTVDLGPLITASPPATLELWNLYRSPRTTHFHMGSTYGPIEYVLRMKYEVEKITSSEQIRQLYPIKKGLYEPKKMCQMKWADGSTTMYICCQQWIVRISVNCDVLITWHLSSKDNNYFWGKDAKIHLDNICNSKTILNNNWSMTPWTIRPFAIRCVNKTN